MKFYLTFLLVLSMSLAFAQDPAKQKELQAVRTIKTPKIDGVLDDACWINVPIATDFF
ncbi:hypothetical protein [Pedobacter agri]|nr:hypothetical protein [Pedobacter agri]